MDHHILIDAVSGVTRLSLEQLVAIEHVFITHSHLDHILALPLLLYSVGGMRDYPVTVYALDAVIEILRQDIFNWRIWPDFTEVPPERPYLRYEAIEVFEPVQLGARAIIALPASHTVPAVAINSTAVPPVWCSAATPSRIRRCGIGSIGLKICGP